MDSQDVNNCILTLEKLLKDGSQLLNLTEEQRIALFKAAGELTRPDKLEKKRRNREKVKAVHQQKKLADRYNRAQTGIRLARTLTVFEAPKKVLPAADYKPQHLKSPRNCYVCKAEFTQLHHFYDLMCPTCAEYNYEKRFQTADLRGQVALITGSRLKIGYQCTLMLLRAGAEVIATTRFPVDSALRFSKEADYEEWKDRLHIYGLDLRHTPSVELFSRYIAQKISRLDIIINNAAQTVRRPPGFYAHMMENESKPFHELPVGAQHILRMHQDCIHHLRAFDVRPEGKESQESALTVSWHGQSPGVGIRASAQLSQIPYSYDQSLDAKEIFPEGKLDADLQQVDLRTTNSWRYTIDEVPTPELIEVQLVNSIAPFVLNKYLIPVMKRDFTGCKHIVNVTAMEGKFQRFKKEERHPHTNMAKAALNMMTHTAAGGLKEFGIYMNAVDTGWVTDEDPMHLAVRKTEMHDFQPPLDIVDGAARVCDPFFYGINTGHHWCGKFLKDYQPIDW